MTHNHQTDDESLAQHQSHALYHIRSEHLYLPPEGCGFHMRRLEGCGFLTKWLLQENDIDFLETNQQNFNSRPAVVNPRREGVVGIADIT